MCVDALDAAARLARVEERPVNQVLDRMGHVRVGAHVGRVLAAQFQAGADEAAGRGLLHCVTAGDRAGEGDEVDQRRRHHLRRLLVAAMHELEHAFRQAGFAEAFVVTLGAKRCLVRMLQDHRVAGHDRRHHRVHRGQVRIVPRRQHQHRARRLAPDEAAKALCRTGIDIGQRLRGDRHHVARPLLEAPHFAGRLADRPAHLPGDFLRDLFLARHEGVDKAVDDCGAAGDWHPPPLRLRAPGQLQRVMDVRVGRKRPLDIDAAVDGGNGLLNVGHDGDW